ncbi:igiC [Rhodococcus sp. NPDC057529]|uniref:maleate cis-trans isomerase family protein n=1 Tax=Rhodococcus sp. NPDC057529 TaxID=3346158 RepID=UPI003671B5F6
MTNNTDIAGTTHDRTRYRNAMGPRGVIGVMTPGPNVNVENEMMDMRPEGVVNAIDRYYVPNQSIGEDEDWTIIMKHVAANLDDSVERLSEALIDHLVLAMSSQSFMGGVRGSFALLDHLREKSGVDVSMGAQAAEQALKEVGARRVALVTPYYPVIEKNAASYFEGRGFEVVHVEGLKCRSIVEVGSQTPDRLRSAVTVANSFNPDAIIQLGTNLRFGEVAPVLEEELGKPVWAVGTVIYWHALRAMKIDDQLEGFGSLLAKH